MYLMLLYQLKMIKKLLEKLRTGFKRTIKLNKYRSEMTNQTKNKNLYCFIDPTFLTSLIKH